MRAPRLLLALLITSLALADDTVRPRHNGAYVRDDVASLIALAEDAKKAAVAGDPRAASDRLDALLLAGEEGLLPVRERLLYVSPRRWAQIQLLWGMPPFGAEVLAAWRATRDAEANAAIRGAILSDDEAELLALIDRYPAATAAPGALLALSDRALERGLRDEALGYLLRVADHLGPGEETLLSSEGYRRRAEFHKALREAPPSGWPTEGGDASRARCGDALPPPAGLVLRWQNMFLSSMPPSLRARESDTTRDVSPTLPFPPVCDADYVYVHLGPHVAAFERETGKLMFYAPEGAAPKDGARSDDRLERAVDELLAKSPGGRAATVSDGVLYFDRALFDDGLPPEPLARNELVAFDVAARGTLWRRVLYGEGRSEGRQVFFRGAPAVVGHRLYVFGAVRDVGDDGPTPKEEAHIFCLDRRDGKVLWRRFLGYGETDAGADFPPYSGLAPAVGKGIVAVVTGLGVAATLDARSGDLLWLLRYDRRPSRERERLAELGRERMVALSSGWMREPPRIVGDSVYFAPFDAEEMFCCWLRGVKTPQGFEVEQWVKDRAKGHRHSLLEYVGGVRGGRIWYVGRRDPRPALTVTYQAVVSHPLDRSVGFAYGMIPFDDRDRETGEPVPPEIYGSPVIAGDALLVPTRRSIFRFDLGREPLAAVRDGERWVEVPALPPYTAPPRGVRRDEAAFGSLVSVDGFLFATTSERIFCYGPPK